MSKTTIYQVHKAMFRDKPLLFIGVFLSSFLLGRYISGWFWLLGILFFAGWWLQCRDDKLSITDDMITLQIGLFSRRVSDIRIRDATNIQIKQNPLQRLLRVGKIEIGSSATGGYEISISGIPYPHKVREIVHQRRDKLEQQKNNR